MILFYRRGALGDTLLTFPVLELLKRQNKYIVAVGNTDYFKLAKHIGWVDKVFSDIPNLDFEQKIIFSYDHIPPFPSKREWIVDYYLKSLNLNSNFSKTLPISYKESPLENKVVLHPSSGSFKKIPSSLLFEKIESYLNKFGFETIYLVGEIDAWIKNYTSNIYESFDIVDLAHSLKGAKMFIGLDSGISHLASYVGVKTFIFYGPTDHIVWKPVGDSIQMYLDMPCSPCFPNICDTRDCFDVDELFKRFLEVFKSPKTGLKCLSGGR